MVFDEEDINVVVSPAIDYRILSVGLTWEKLLNEPQENNITRTSFATKLDVSDRLLISPFSFLGAEQLATLMFNIGIQKQPVQWGKMSPMLRLQYLERHSNYMNSTQGPNSTHTKSKNIDHIISFIRSVTENNCNNR